MVGKGQTQDLPRGSCSLASCVPCPHGSDSLLPASARPPVAFLSARSLSYFQDLRKIRHKSPFSSRPEDLQFQGRVGDEKEEVTGRAATVRDVGALRFSPGSHHQRQEHPCQPPRGDQVSVWSYVLRGS